MHSLTFLSRFTLAAALVSACFGCSTATTLLHQGERLVTQGKYDHTIDANDENEAGKSVGLLVTNLYPPSEDKKLVDYVNLVGLALVSSSDHPTGQYVFSVLETKDIGAYAGPGGYIFITRGAIGAMHNEAELAGLLAHQIIHVQHRHAIESAIAQAEKDGYMDAKTQGMMTADGNRLIDAVVDVAVRNGYDKGQEQDADQGAARLLTAVGYDPLSYAAFLSRLATLEKTDARKRLNTHYDYAEQARNVQQASSGTSGGATLKDRFAAAAGKWTM